jgi:hypothetical protein
VLSCCHNIRERQLEPGRLRAMDDDDIFSPDEMAEMREQVGRDVADDLVALMSRATRAVEYEREQAGEEAARNAAAAIADLLHTAANAIEDGLKDGPTSS